MAGPHDPRDDVKKTLGVGRSRAPRKVGRWIGLGIALVLVAVVAVGIVKARGRAGGPQYLTEAVKTGDVVVTVSATGKLQGLNTVEIGAEVTGRVLRVLVDYNDRVTKGQVLAELDPEQLRASVEESTAQVLSSEASIKTAEVTILETKQAAERAEEQSRQGLIAKKELEAAQAAYARAQASLASSRASANLSKASLKSATSRLDKTKIITPIDGIVLARAVEPGQTVTAGFQTPVLFRVAEDLARLTLHVDIDEADVGRVRPSSTASFTVDAYPDRQFPSKVTSLRNEPKSSQSVVTYEAVLTVDNQELLLRPGMTATATIVSETIKNVRTIPNAALRFAPPPIPGAPNAPAPKPGEKRVYVLRPGAPLPVAVPVVTGATDGRVTQLVSGDLPDGTQVVVDALAAR